MITKDELAKRLLAGCDALVAAEPQLTQIDSQFGDADHGLTMTKIARATRTAIEASEGGVQEMLDDIATAVMAINGGSAVPLWNTWLDGLQEEAPETGAVDIATLKNMFTRAITELKDISGAKVGDKTLMDALIPATEAIAACPDDASADDFFRAAAQAALAGAENTKNFSAKYGRAKSYGQKTIGTPDAGAVSMAAFFRGLALE